MIPFDFIYCRPETLAEAIDAYRQLHHDGKNPVYCAGATEVITMCRAGSIRPGAVISIKNIPECMDLSMNEQGLSIGAACTLNKIKESKLFPLLGTVCGRIADHTNQCTITLGGNLCATIIYREASLPLLLSDATATLLGEQGLRTIAFQSVFQGRMQMAPGEMLVKVQIPRWALQAPYFHVKRTQNEKIDYPLASVAALRKDNFLRLALSGVCPYPFRSSQMEAVLNERALSCAARAEEAAALLPGPVRSNVEGTEDYKKFVLKNTLEALLEDWDNDKI